MELLLIAAGIGFVITVISMTDSNGASATINEIRRANNL